MDSAVGTSSTGSVNCERKMSSYIIVFRSKEIASIGYIKKHMFKPFSIASMFLFYFVGLLG